jgi:hypothetical protein
MTESNSAQPANPKGAKLPQRDWILLPTIGLLTICLLLGSTELIARRMLTKSNTGGEDCMVFHDPSNGPRGIPNSVCWEKIPEGKLTEYRFNSSGFRNDFNFGPKAPGTYRIVMIGTSDAGGFRVPQSQTFGTLLPVELSQLTGRRIELYNEGLPWRSPDMIALHFDAVLATHPDLIFWVLSPMDIERTSWDVQPDEARALNLKGRALYHIRAALEAKSLSASLAEIFSHARTATLLKDLLYKSRSQYVKSSLIGADDKTGFLKKHPSLEWQERLEAFDKSAAKIEAQARDGGIPLVAVLLPDRTEVAMVAMMGEKPKGFDPYKLDDELRSIIVSRGETYIDILPGFRTIPDPQLGYYAIDGHPNPDGHATIARFMARALTDGSVPALKAAAQPRAALEQSR